MSTHPAMPARVRHIPSIRRLVAPALVLLAIVISLVASTGARAAGDTTGVDTTRTPWVGLLAPNDTQAKKLVHTGVTRVMVASGWNVMEPSQGVFATDLLQALRKKIAGLRRQGFAVVLDPGLQYPPAWAFDLPGATRFVDQYGDVWHGDLSTDVPNAVFDPAVRTAEANYLSRLGAALRGAGLAGVRVGGLLSGELRLPPNTYAGRTDALWGFDAQALTASPVPGWRPGTGSADDARTFLDWYTGRLTDFQVWLMRTTGAAFPGIDQQLLLPGWGLRPGMVDAAVDAGVVGKTNAEVNGMLASGSDWAGEVAAAAATGLPVTVYSTWVDAPEQGRSVQQITPIEYLAGLARQAGLPVAGENTGRGGPAALALTLQRARQFGLTGVMYMSGALLDDGTAGLTLRRFIRDTNRFTS